jgi:hypothetical protein
MSLVSERAVVKQPSKCAVCDTYDFKGMWKCGCDAMNVSKNDRCWKCGDPKIDTK